jgi:hypothetical protein
MVRFSSCNDEQTSTDSGDLVEDCAMSIIDKDEGVDGLQVVSDTLT